MKKRFIILITLCLFTQVFAATTSKSQTGEKTYRNSCAVCHANGVAKAPKVHDTSAWQQRLNLAEAAVKKQQPNAKPSEIKAKAIELLVSHVKDGMGVMPAKGMCNQCSDQDYQNAIEYMMSKAKN